MSAAIKFSEERLMKVLQAPVISEKATMVAEKNEQIVFRVMPDATKPEIKAAVELLFKVEVLSVQTVNREGKQKRSGRFTGRRNHTNRHASGSRQAGEPAILTRCELQHRRAAGRVAVPAGAGPGAAAAPPRAAGPRRR